MSSIRGRGPFYFTLVSGFIIVFISLYGFILLCQRPGVPRDIPTARLVRVDDIDIHSLHYLNYALAGKAIGSDADFYVQTPEGQVRLKRAGLVAYYSRSIYPAVCLVIGLLTAGLGFLAYILKPLDTKARIFFWLTLTFFAALVINSEEYGLHPDRWPTYVPAVLFIVSYALAPAVLFHFSFSFSPPVYRIRRGLIYLPGIAFAAAQAALILTAHIQPSLQALKLYSDTYFVFRIYMAAFVLVAVIHLFRAYKKSQEEEPRAQIKWIFFGIAAGLTPFIFFYQLPRALELTARLPEEISNIFFIVLPAAMAIAIIRYRLVDISRVINRSLVYSMLTVFTVGLYLFVILLARGLVVRLVPLRQEVYAVAGVLLAALAFHPAQKRIQDFVDRAFFRQRYDYRRLVYDFYERARDFISADALLEHFLHVVRRALPAERAGIEVGLNPAAGAKGGVSLRLGDRLELDLPDHPPGREEARIWARLSAVQAADLVDTSEGTTLEQSGLDLVLDLPLACASGRGRMALGKKKSGQRYTREDIELLLTLAAEMCVHMERIVLQEEIIYERASREKLDELNRLKTEFISSVSHELRTPMTAIRGLAEVLQAGKLRNREQRERFLNLMVSESGRLSRFLHNVLDFGRIEQQSKAYNLRQADLKSVVEEAMDVLRGALEEQGFHLVLRLPARPVERTVDPDAIKQALINLLDNAMKYSAGRNEVEVELREDGGAAEILVRDRGIGISAEDRERIFGSFYRAESAIRLNPRGAGLGLKIVRHIMEAHAGEVRVESEINAGSTFRLIFPGP